MAITLAVAQSKIKSEGGNFLQYNPTKFTVVHERPVQLCGSEEHQQMMENDNTVGNRPNPMCTFTRHLSVSSPVDQHDENQHQSFTNKSKLKRSLSADDVNMFDYTPVHHYSIKKRPLFYQQQQPVATVLWQDGSKLNNSSTITTDAFVCIKLLEASQARSYLQLQGKQRNSLHLSGGGIKKIVENSANDSPRLQRQLLLPLDVNEAPPRQSLRPPPDLIGLAGTQQQPEQSTSSMAPPVAGNKRKETKLRIRMWRKEIGKHLDQPTKTE